MRGNRALVVSAWGAALVIASAVLWAWSGSLGPAIPLGAAGLAAVVVGFAISPSSELNRGTVTLPDQSAASAVVALGCGIGLIALVGGWWLALIGGAIAALGLAGVIRERRAQRRSRRGPIE